MRRVFRHSLFPCNEAWGLQAIENPLAAYPDRDWEKAYRDLWKYDSTFTFLCAPNDTHNCILNAYVRYGVITRIGPTMSYGEATDLDGNEGQSSLGSARLPEGARAHAPLLRRPPRPATAWSARASKRWVDEGFPRGPTAGRRENTSSGRATSGCGVTHEEAADIVAAALENIAAHLQRRERAKAAARSRATTRQIVQATQGAGTQVLKFRGGMPLLGMTRVFGMYRMANSMALLDAKIRGVGPDQALGGRGFDNYSWHTDLPPGHPMVTGQQTVEFDLHAVEHGAHGGRVGHELDHHEDARRALAHRGAAQGHARSS